MTTFVNELRTAIIGKQDIKLDSPTDGKDIKLNESNSITINNDKTFDLSDKSGFKSNDNIGYDIRTVYFGWLNKDVSVTDYISKCEENSIKVISFMERTDLISYLKGDINTCSYLVGGEENVLSNDVEPSSTTAATTTTEENIKKPEVESRSNTTEKSVSSSTAKTEATIATTGKISSSSKVAPSSSDKQKSKKRVEEVEKIDYKESKRQKLEQDPLLKCINLHEVDLIDHDKALRGTQKSNDFGNLIRECEYKIVRPLKASSSASSASATSKSKTATVSSSSSKSKSKSSTSAISSNDASSLSTILRKKDPIIILSPSAISMLTMNNVKSFLQDGKFIDPQTNTTNAVESSNMVQIIRQSKKFNKKIKFVVVNNVEKFFVKPEYWDRVVAIFTTGQEWQFKNYKINKPNLLFQTVKGFYVNYTGDIVPNNIKNWNVQVISLDRNQRFKDRQISEFLWESIERFMFSKGYK